MNLESSASCFHGKCSNIRKFGGLEGLTATLASIGISAVFAGKLTFASSMIGFQFLNVFARGGSLTHIFILLADC